MFGGDIKKGIFGVSGGVTIIDIFVEKITIGLPKGNTPTYSISIGNNCSEPADF